MALAVVLFGAVFTPLPASAQLTGNSLDADTSRLEAAVGKWIAWYGVSVARSTDHANSGIASLKVAAASANWGVALSNWPGFATKAGEKRLSFSALSVPPSMTSATLTVKWRDSANTTISTHRLLASLGSAWQQVTADVTAPPGTVTVGVELTGDGATPGATAYFDDFYVGDRDAMTTTTTSTSSTSSTSTTIATNTTTTTPGRTGTYPTSPPVQVCGNRSILDGPSAQPAGSVRVDPGQNLDDATKAAPAGTTFWLAPGIHTLTDSGYAQVGTKEGNTYIGAPGAVLDGRRINRYAFTQSAVNVTIKHLRITRFVAPSNEAVINSSAATGWVITNNTIDDNSGSGVFTGNGVLIRDNCITNNGAHGIGGYKVAPAPGYGPSAINNVTVSRNEISYHPRDRSLETNPDGSPTYCGCTGGAKFWDTKGALVSDNYVHHNTSPALWADTNNVDFLIEGNYLSDNGGEAVWYEISYNGTIRNNTFLRNTWDKGSRRAGGDFPDGPIYISESGGDSRVSPNRTTLEISGNYLEDNWGGVALWEGAERFCGSPANTSGSYCTKVNPDVNRAACSDVARLHNEPYFSDCRWKTHNVLVTNNQFKLNKANLPASCTGSRNCGQMALFSNWGADYPAGTPYKGYVVAERITFASNNRFTNNTYTGDWGFTAYHSGTKLKFDQWRAAPYSQDAGSTYSSGSTSTTTTSSTSTSTTTTSTSTTTTMPPTTTSSTTTTTPVPPTYPLLYSTFSNRANPVPLGGATVRGTIYAFTPLEISTVVRVEFWLDDPAMSGAPRLKENVAPFDFAGGTKWTANPWNSAWVANGLHTITARMTFGDGTTAKAQATFTVSN